MSQMMWVKRLEDELGRPGGRELGSASFNASIDIAP